MSSKPLIFWLVWIYKSSCLIFCLIT